MTEHEMPIMYTLIAERRHRGWSLQDVADRLMLAPAEVKDWEQGRATPSLNTIEKLCKLYDLSPGDLILAEASCTRQDEGYHVINDPHIPLSFVPLYLVGRESEIAQLKQALFAARTVAFAAIHGIPGVGKTTLALELAYDEEIQAYFRHGVLWASLGTVPDIVSIYLHWASLLGLEASEVATIKSVEEWHEKLRTLIGERQFLFIIDDVWQLEHALLCNVGGPRCGYILTTRFAQIALAFAAQTTLTLEELPEEESLLLLETLAPDVVAQEPDQVKALVQAVGGLPLALTLIGNYLRIQAEQRFTYPNRVRAAFLRLHDVQERLSLSQPPVPVNDVLQQDMRPLVSLQAVIAMSDQQLDEEAQTVLRALSVFPAKPNSFPEAAALVVSRGSAQTLDKLSDAGLLESAGPDRYTIHHTIADYARVHLSENEPIERFISYFTEYIERYSTDYRTLEQERNLLLATLDTTFAYGDTHDLVRGVLAFVPFLIARGLYLVAERHLKRVLERGSHEDVPTLISTLRYLGEVEQKQGHYSQAEPYYREGLALASSSKNLEHQCSLLASMGTLAEKQGRYEQAKEFLQEGLVLARQLGNERLEAILLRLLGLVSDLLGDYLEAEHYLQAGLTITRTLQDPELTCALLNNAGMVASDRGNYRQADEYLQAGLVIAREEHFREWIVLLLLNLGVAASHRGRKGGEQEELFRSDEYNQEALRLAREMGSMERCCNILINLSDTALYQEEYTQAYGYVQEALTIATEIEKPLSICNASIVLGNLHLKLGQKEQAERAFQEALSHLPVGAQYQEALAHYGLACVAGAYADLDAASTIGKHSLAIFKAIGHNKASEVQAWLTSLTVIHAE